MHKLPALSGRDGVRGLERLGFERIGQRGSHIKLRKGGATVVVPDHREIRRDTRGNILRMANIAVEDLINAVAQ